MPQVPLKTKKATNPLNTSGFLRSPRQEEIFDIINEGKGKVTKAEMHRRIKELDPNVPGYQTFIHFMRKLDKNQGKRAGVLLANLKDSFLDDKNVGEDILKTLLNNAYKKIFVMGDVVVNQTIAEVKRKLEAGEPLSKEEKKNIMEWFFKSSDSFAKHRSVDLKVKADERAETLMENLISAAQYGHTSKKDIVEGQFEEVKKIEAQIDVESETI